MPVLEIETTTNGNIRVSNNQSLVAIAAIGDSIIKFKNDNEVLVKKPNGYKLLLFYVEIPKHIRQHHNFPKAWKHKWPEVPFNVH